MAGKLGLNPQSLSNTVLARSQPWKTPVDEWSRNRYHKLQAKVAKRTLQEVKGEWKADEIEKPFRGKKPVKLMGL